MLNPPLSLLSDDLLVSIVEQLAKLPFADWSLKNLSLADRAFTQSCQKYILRKLVLGNGMNIPRQLTKVKKFLDNKPSFIDRVRIIKLQVGISSEKSALLFKDPNFTSILQLFTKSPMPPHELHFTGRGLVPVVPSIMEDTIPVMRQLEQSFFSQTLTILHVIECANVPLSIFLAFPRLRDLILDRVGATDKSHDKYPDNQCSGRDVPLLEVFNYRESHSLIEQMIAPPPRFKTSVVLWSNLRVLTLAPHDKGGMACLQPILDAACNTLEELYLTSMAMSGFRQLSLSELVNLSNLPNLHAFSLYTIVNCKAPRNAPPFAVLHDINIVLGTIPKSNRVTNLLFWFNIVGRRPFHGSLDQDWVGTFNEVIRIGGEKPLEFDLQMGVSREDFKIEHPGQDELYMRIVEKAALLSNYPNICTHTWNPTFWSRGLGPFPLSQVRRRCRR